MAIGDAAIQKLGAANVSRQPAAGVEEELHSFTFNGDTDQWQLDDGSAVSSFTAAGVRGDTDISMMRQTKIMISNAIFLTKSGTTNIGTVTGVQTNV